MVKDKEILRPHGQIQRLLGWCCIGMTLISLAMTIKHLQIGIDAPLLLLFCSSVSVLFIVSFQRKYIISINDGGTTATYVICAGVVNPTPLVAYRRVSFSGECRYIGKVKNNEGNTVCVAVINQRVIQLFNESAV